MTLTLTDLMVPIAIALGGMLILAIGIFMADLSRAMHRRKLARQYARRMGRSKYRTTVYRNGRATHV